MTTYLSVKEAAELCGVSSKTIRRYLTKGVIVSKTIRGKRGMEYRILKSSLLQYFRRSGYIPPENMPEEDGDEGDILVRLKNLVPKYLYDDVFSRYIELQQQNGQLKEQIDQHKRENKQAEKEIEGLKEVAAAHLALTYKYEALKAEENRWQEVARHNGELMQSLAEKDALISILEKTKPQTPTPKDKKST